MIRFFVPGKVVPWSSPKTNRWGGSQETPRSARLKDYQVKVMLFARQAGCRPVTTAVLLRMHFLIPRPKRSNYWYPRRPDLTNLVKAGEDALAHVAFANDSQVVEQCCSKRYAAAGEEPGVWITVEPVSEGD